jgi:hypothetical protein
MLVTEQTPSVTPWRAMRASGSSHPMPIVAASGRGARLSSTRVNFPLLGPLG